jgi:hypothetical protein
MGNFGKARLDKAQTSWDVYVGGKLHAGKVMDKTKAISMATKMATRHAMNPAKHYVEVEEVGPNGRGKVIGRWRYGVREQ